MRNQLYIASAAFGFGALLGWGITADLKEVKARRNRDALRDVIASQAELINNLRSTRFEMRTGVDVFNPEEGSTKVMDTVDELQQSLPFVEDDEPAEVRFLSEAQVESISLDKQPNAFGESVHVVETEISPEESTSEDEEDPIPPGETPEQTRTNLQNLINQYTANPDDVDLFVDRAQRQTAPDYKPPFVISRSLFAWDPDEGDDFRKVTISYYPTDRVLLDEDNDVIEDVEATVGWRSLSQFGFESEDADVVFVRNRQLETDFEVVRETESELPLHVKYGMGRDEFAVNKAAGNIRFRQEDRD